MRFQTRKKDGKSLPMLTAAVVGQSGDLNSVISLFQNGISSDNKNASLYLNLGVAWLNNNSPDSAMYYIQKSIDLKKDNPDAFKNLGIAYANIGVKYHQANNFRQAINYYKKGLEFNEQQS